MSISWFFFETSKWDRPVDSRTEWIANLFRNKQKATSVMELGGGEKGCNDKWQVFYNKNGTEISVSMTEKISYRV